jgi:hypothetical protein
MQSPTKTKAASPKFKFDWFMRGMVLALALALAFVWPEPGARAFRAGACMC